MINYSNRGKIFEKIIMKSLNNIKDGIFFRSPTPIKPIAIKYSNGRPVITHAVFENKSLCDFYGLYKNQFILIEAKEVKTTSFNLKNIKDHQIEQLKKIKQLGGQSFIIIHFVKYKSYICIPIDSFLELSFEKKSIKFCLLKEKGYSLKLNNLTLNIDESLDYFALNQL